MAIAKAHVNPPKEPEDSDVEELEEEIEAVTSKRLKHDPLAEFRNAAGDEPRKKSTAEVNEELSRYGSITGVYLTQAHAFGAYLIRCCGGVNKGIVFLFV